MITFCFDYKSNDINEGEHYLTLHLLQTMFSSCLQSSVKFSSIKSQYFEESNSRDLCESALCFECICVECSANSSFLQNTLQLYVDANAIANFCQALTQLHHLFLVISFISQHQTSLDIVKHNELAITNYFCVIRQRVPMIE
jgi:hypothetical protein